MAKATPAVNLAFNVGKFYELSFATLRQLFRRPFPLKEMFEQAWFIVSVSIVPTVMMAIPFCVIIVFQLNQLLTQVGATDLSGAGAGLAVVREIGPMVSVLVVAGAGATAMCADLGSRTIREEIDALRVMGIDPIPRLVVPRVLASTGVAVALNGAVSLVGLSGSFFFSVYVQHGSPGIFLSSLTLLTNVGDFLVSELKSAVFGLLAGLVACHLGLNAKGGPKGVGEAVNQTVVFAFLLLFLADSIITAVYLQFRY